MKHFHPEVSWTGAKCKGGVKNTEAALWHSAQVRHQKYQWPAGLSTAQVARCEKCPFWGLMTFPKLTCKPFLPLHILLNFPFLAMT